MYILGDPFLRNFYTTFDYEDNQMSLAVSSTAALGTTITRYYSVAVIALFVMIVLMVVVIISVLLFWLWRRKQN